MPNESTAVGRLAANPDSAAGSTSLLPIQTLTNVGLASSARCTCVLPPRMNVVSALSSGVVGEVGSIAAAPGTATLLSTDVMLAGLRRLHIGALAPPSVAPVVKFTIGGGHPGKL